jgi:DNA-binding NtrC family response regulator
MPRERILVVDDDPGILAFLGRCLADEGYDVVPARDGAEAIGRLTAEPFALILTDMKMPRVDGLTLLREARRLRPDVAIVVLTGHGTLENAIAALREEGAYDYLLKPLERLEALGETVRRALQRRRQLLADRALLTRLEQENRALSQELERRVHELKLAQQKLEAWKTIDRAKGILARRLGIPADRALNLIRYKSRSDQRTMHETAAEIVANDAYFAQIEKTLDNLRGPE